MASARAARRTRRTTRRRSSWLPLALGLFGVAVALYLLARGEGSAPLGDIDANSRAQLQQVLEEADRREAAR